MIARATTPLLGPSPPPGLGPSHTNTCILETPTPGNHPYAAGADAPHHHHEQVSLPNGNGCVQFCTVPSFSITTFAVAEPSYVMVSFRVVVSVAL